VSFDSNYAQPDAKRAIINDSQSYFRKVVMQSSIREKPHDGSVITTKSSRGGETLLLPRLKLKVVQEAMRVVLEVVYKPQFSKISHGCRSGRGYHSALRFISDEIRVLDWCFTVPVQKEVDNNVTSKLISLIQEKIEDVQLVKFLQDMFDAKVINLVFGGSVDTPRGMGFLKKEYLHQS
jgi:hypothetical protein